MSVLVFADVTISGSDGPHGAARLDAAAMPRAGRVVILRMTDASRSRRHLGRAHAPFDQLTVGRVDEGDGAGSCAARRLIVDEPGDRVCTDAIHDHASTARSGPVISL